MFFTLPSLILSPALDTLVLVTPHIRCTFAILSIPPPTFWYHYSYRMVTQDVPVFHKPMVMRTVTVKP